MGATIQVFLSRSKVPTVDDWNAALQREGFDLVIDPFELLSDDGYCPAFLKGKESGFEWYLSEVSKSEKLPDHPFKAFVGNCDLRAQLCFTSQANEEVVSVIAGAVLAKLCGGFYWDPETDQRFLQNEEAISVARKLAAQKGFA
jgi:hypothetical protein